jgi:RNA polymerase sigma-70 factor (ECF subfamily)
VFALLGFLLRDAGEREDVAQESFLAAWRGLGTFDPRRGTFVAWLLAIARHRALNALRRPRPARPVHAEPWADAATPADPAVGRRLDASLRELAVDLRVTYLLVDVHGLPLATVAEIEDVPVGTVKSRCARAREHLRTALRSAGGRR